MKKLAIICVVLILSSALMAQTTEKRVLKPDTPIQLKSADGARDLTGGDMWRELNQYKAEKKVTNGAYEVKSRGFRSELVIPMLPAVRERLAQQQENFTKTAVTAVPVQTRGNDQTWEIGYNQQWGDQGSFAAYIDALAKIYGSAESRAVHAHLYAGGYVFNQDVKAIEFTSDIQNTNGAANASTVLRIFGETKFSSNVTMLHTQQFFNGEIGKTVEFFIGPVPVSVRGSIGGQAGFEAKLGLYGNGVRGSVTPSITVYGKADAGIDLWFVKAGVEGQIDLLIDNLPIVATTELLTEGGLKLDMGLKVENHLLALRGKIDVFVDVYVLWDDEWERYSMNLFSWGGIQKDWLLYERSAQIPLN
jgi:hypothetical protein